LVPTLATQILQPNSRIRATWDGYTGDMEEHLNNPDVRVLVPSIPPLKVRECAGMPGRGNVAHCTAMAGEKWLIVVDQTTSEMHDRAARAAEDFMN
jgi:hypothetical protein